MRFKGYGVAPRSAADFAFLLHGFHYLKYDGVMPIILPHRVLFRGGQEEHLRTKLLKDGHIDTTACQRRRTATPRQSTPLRPLCQCRVLRGPTLEEAKTPRSALGVGRPLRPIARRAWSR